MFRSLSLLGAALCFFIMFSTHWDYALISLALCLAIYKYVEWKGYAESTVCTLILAILVPKRSGAMVSVDWR